MCCTEALILTQFVLCVSVNSTIVHPTSEPRDAKIYSQFLPFLHTCIQSTTESPYCYLRNIPHVYSLLRDQYPGPNHHPSLLDLLSGLVKKHAASTAANVKIISPARRQL